MCPSHERLFANLDRWRRFPSCPLEARVDTIMGLFLPKIIEARCGTHGVNAQVIPQFALKHCDTNRSDKVDFFAITKDNKRAFLVEIKTEMGSLVERQFDYLDEARKRGLTRMITDLKEITKASIRNRSKNFRKYFYLIDTPSEMKLLGLSSELE